MAIKLIAFDWNGTLLADTKLVIKATNIARSAFGYPAISTLKYKKTFTIPVIDFWLATGGKKEDMKTEHLHFHPAYERLAKKAQMRPSARELLLWLKKNKIAAVIYSNHTLPEITHKLKMLRIKPFIKAVLARRDAEDTIHLHQRNKQTKLQEYLRQQKLKPKEVVSVGDTEEEVEIGHSLGLHTVAITRDENTIGRLKKHHPDFLIHNMLE